MKCCGNCFSDRSLLESLIPSLSCEYGTCSYCDTENVTLVLPAALGELFGPLISIYEPSPDGKLLVEWMKEDWGMFNDVCMDIPRAKSLLADVLDDGDIVRRRFVPSSRYQSNGLNRWVALCSELMYTNRYFPDSNIDHDRLSGLLLHLRSINPAPIWHRARIQQGDVAYDIGAMGAPPKRITSHGRANPPGIPYLYLGSTEQTAVSEIRPHTGEKVSIASFSLLDGLQMIDLRDPKSLISPFFFGDEDQIGAIRSDIPFLEQLGKELTKPVAAGSSY